MSFELGVDQFEIDIRRTGRVGANGHEIIGPFYLDAVAGVVEQPDRAARQFGAELADRALQAGAVEIGLRLAADQLKSDRLQRRRDQSRIVFRIGQPRQVLVGAVADDQCDPLCRPRRRRTGRRADQHEQA